LQDAQGEAAAAGGGTASASIDLSPAKRLGNASKDETSQHYSNSFESGQLSESLAMSSKDERSHQYSASFEPLSPKEDRSQSQYYSTSFEQSSPVSTPQVRESLIPPVVREITL